MMTFMHIFIVSLSQLVHQHVFLAIFRMGVVPDFDLFKCAMCLKWPDVLLFSTEKLVFGNLIHRSWLPNFQSFQNNNIKKTVEMILKIFRWFSKILKF